MALAPGTRLGPYEITAPLGAGGMGEVYKATRHAPRPHGRHQGPARARRGRSRAEAAVRARSQDARGAQPSAHLPASTTSGSRSGIDFLVMEYLEGETLAQRLTRARCRSTRRCRSAIQIADALDKAHREGIVHRDLKPGNIMLTQERREAARLRAGEAATGRRSAARR